ncbi:MAG: hypothetical protein KIT16_20700 [Rhodospirillaceae bacterium]|nr:hypothetical protein [Rhodospirillaceae bacterium]
MNRLAWVPLGLAGLFGLTILAGIVIFAFVVENDAGARTPAPPGLVGTWSTSRVSTIGYRNRVTGTYASPSGHIYTYTIAADGRYTVSGLLQSTLYNCTISIFKSESGVLAIAGDRLTLTPREGKVISKDTCHRWPDKTRDVVDPPTTFTWRLETGTDGKPILVLTKANGEAWGRFHRR